MPPLTSLSRRHSRRTADAPSAPAVAAQPRQQESSTDVEDPKDAMTASQKELAAKIQSVLELLREAEVEEVVVRFRVNPAYPTIKPRIIFEVEDLIAAQ